MEIKVFAPDHQINAGEQQGKQENKLVIGLHDVIASGKQDQEFTCLPDYIIIPAKPAMYENC